MPEDVSPTFNVFSNTMSSSLNLYQKPEEPKIVARVKSHEDHVDQTINILRVKPWRPYRSNQEDILIIEVSEDKKAQKIEEQKDLNQEKVGHKTKTWTGG